MEPLPGSGLLIDLVIGLSMLEGVALAVYHRISGRGIAPREFAANLVSGLCLMLALRAAVTSAAWSWMALWLLAAGVAHWSDLWQRWRR